MGLATTQAPFWNFVEPTHDIIHWGRKQAANAKQSAQCYRLAGFDLLPIAHGVSVRKHIFLAVPSPFAQLSDPRSQSFEKVGLIPHTVFLNHGAL
jgi:hypothetical protein